MKKKCAAAEVNTWFLNGPMATIGISFSHIRRPQDPNKSMSSARRFPAQTGPQLHHGHHKVLHSAPLGLSRPSFARTSSTLPLLLPYD